MFDNLKDVAKIELAKELEKALDNYKEYLTEKEVAKIETGKKSVQDYFNKINNKVWKGYKGKQLARIETVEKEENTIVSMTITVEWKKNRTWGSNPTATLEVIYKNGFNRFTSESISGCGYDKESTATGQALTQCNALLKLMYAIKDSNIDKSNHDVLGYGSGYGLLPYFEGGVGFNCHQFILEDLGFKYAHTASGKTFDVYSFTI